MKDEEIIFELTALQQFINQLDKPSSMGARVRRVMNEELTERQRELVRLYYFENMTMPEIADRLGITVSTVSRTITRGRGRIKRYLKYNGRGFMGTID